MPKIAFYQQLRAPNDRNGNPRRLFVAYSYSVQPVRVYDEGYTGVPEDLREVRAALTVDVSVTEYRRFLRIGADLEGGVCWG